MALALFWIAALVCTIVATVGAIASTEPTANAQDRAATTPDTATAIR